MSNKVEKRGLAPKLRFPEFRDDSGWGVGYGDKLFDQINNRQATPGLPILAITQEYGAIPRDAIDYHVSVTDKSVETYKARAMAKLGFTSRVDLVRFAMAEGWLGEAAV